MFNFRLAIRTALIAFALSILIAGADFVLPAFHVINLRGRDIFFRVRHNFFSSIPKEAGKITLVGLDDETLEKLKTRWPYPRSFYAQALERLKPFDTKAIGFDLLFSGNDFRPESDTTFSTALKDIGNVVIASHKNYQGGVGPADMIRDSVWAVGVVDKPRDSDRIIRRFYPEKKIDNQLYGSWEFKLFEKAHPEQAKTVLIKEDPLAINYQLTPKQFRQIPFWKLIGGEFLSEEVRGKIILFGLTSETFHDIHATPLGSMPGLVVNANTLLTLMTNGFFSYVPFWIQWLLVFVALWIILQVAIIGTAVVGVITVLFLSIILLASSFLLFTHQIILDVWLMILGMIVTLIVTIVYREGQLFLENLRLREESSRDPLTGFYSRRFMELKLKSELGRMISRRGGLSAVKEISVVMVDLDNFKLVNDSFGHGEGDRVLRTMSQAIHSSVRKDEIICRYGGDEFCVILTNVPIANAAQFAEKLRSIIANHPDLAYKTASGVDTIRVTASIGVASVSAVKAMEPGGVLKAADRALYRAKKGGRNRVCIYDPEKDVIE